MSWLSALRFALPVAGALALVLLFMDQQRLDAIVDRQRACEQAAGNDELAVTSCAQSVADAIALSRRSAACERAINTGDLFVQRSACGAATKRALAALDAATGERDRLVADLAAARRSQDQAVGRAELRGATTSQRIRDNALAIERAPRADDGRRMCDADCLRTLAGRPPTADRR
ncbi:hypothetical protein ACPVPU_07375 [Sphingomonas sp. CJ99]